MKFVRAKQFSILLYGIISILLLSPLQACSTPTTRPPIASKAEVMQEERIQLKMLQNKR